MCEVLNQTKNGLSALDLAVDEFVGLAAISSSMVSMRFLVSWPVSSIVWLPSAFALQSRTPRGPNFLRKFG